MDVMSIVVVFRVCYGVDKHFFFWLLHKAICSLTTKACKWTTKVKHNWLENSH